MSDLVLPFPPRDLMPNRKKQHRYTKDIRNGYKKDCWTLAKEAKFRASHLDITFYPPTGHRRDLDNLLAAMKSGLDGLSLAMGIDDAEWTFTLRRGPIHRPGGKVVIRDGGQE